MGCFRLSSEPLIFFYTIIFTINYTCLPQLVLEKVCLKENHGNTTTCKDLNNLSDDLQKEASNWWFYLLTCSLVPSVFTVIIWGPITDAIGRKKAMVFVPFVNGLRALVYLTNSYFLNAHPAYLLFGSFLSCFYGEFQGVVALCYAYMADVTADDLNQRTMRMAFIEAGVFGAGIPAGLLSGYLLQQIGFVPVFILTLGINVIILLYVVCFLPSSEVHSDPVQPSPVNVKSNLIGSSGSSQEIENELPSNVPTVNGAMNLFNPFYHFKHVFQVITNKECRRIVLPLILAFGLSVCAVLGELIVQTLYLKNKPFEFSFQEIGYYSAVQSAIRGLGVIVITQLSFRWLHLEDYTLIIVGLISQIVCYLLIGFARSTVVVFLVNIAGVATPVATATLRSLVTKQVSEKHYGTVLASLEAMDAISGVITNSLSLWTYNLTLTIYSGVVYFALSFLSLLSLVVVILTLCIRQLGKRRIEAGDQ